MKWSNTWLLMGLMLVLFSRQMTAQNQNLSNSLDIKLTSFNEIKPTFPGYEQIKTEQKHLTDATEKQWAKNDFFFDEELDKYFPQKGSHSYFNIYLGLNNWIEGNDLPSSSAPYSLKPINSWFLGVSFDNVSRIFGPLYFNYGIGVSYLDYSFENTRIQVIKTDDALFFNEIENISGRKSKINVGYLNAHFVPTFSFGKYSSFRFGLGVYGGYRIDSNSKMKFDDANGEKQKQKINDSLHIQSFKYGLRAQIGWRDFDLFMLYDLHEFFEEEVLAPRLTPITFGIIF